MQTWHCSVNSAQDVHNRKLASEQMVLIRSLHGSPSMSIKRAATSIAALHFT